jgi:hypothetical protein
MRQHAADLADPSGQPEPVEGQLVTTDDPIEVDGAIATRVVRLANRRIGEFALFLGISAVLHIPALVGRLFSSDEASIASMAMVINHGGKLYHQTADRKPPIVPYLYAAVFEITGSLDLRPVRAVGVVVLAITALLLAMEAERRYGDRRRGIACGVLFLAASVTFFPADTQAATFELFMLLPLTGAVLASREKRPILAGACLALAILCKQTAFTTVIPMAWLLLPQGRRAVVRAGATCAAIIAAVAAFFGPAQFLLWTLSGNRGYLAIVGPVFPMLLRAFAMNIAFVGFNLALLALAARARFKRDNIDLWLWVASGIFAVVAGFRFFGHYYLQLLPPLSLLAAGAFPLSRSALRRAAVIGIAFPSVVMILVGLLTLRTKPTGEYPAVASRIRHIAPPNATMFVWGQLPELYWASGIEPGTRFIHNAFITGNSGGRVQGASTSSDGMPGAWEMLEADVSAHLPTVIVDTTNADVRGSQYYPLRKTPIWPVVRADYRLVTTVDHMQVYYLRPNATPPRDVRTD